MTGGFWAGKRVLVTGAHGFLGHHVLAALRGCGIGTGDLVTPSQAEADLREPLACARVVDGVHVVIHLAARTGGVGLHQERPGELFYDTALMGLLLMEAARVAGVRKFVGIGSTCAYPDAAPVPFSEAALWDGPPNPVTGDYGHAKKMLLVQGQAYRRQYGFDAVHLMPVNLYGPHDHFDEQHGHVIASLVRRIVEAADRGDASVAVWGSGRATREFLHAADAARAVLLACERDAGGEPINLGSGVETSIRDLAGMIAAGAGYTGELTWDPDRPDGAPRRRVDVERARERLGFTASIPLEQGLAETIAWYREHR